MRLRVLVCLCMCLCAAHTREDDDVYGTHYLNSFVIRTYSPLTAARVARDYGFELVQKIPDLDYYHLSHPSVSHRSKRHAADMVLHLGKDPRVQYVEQQVELDRAKRSHIIHDKQLEFPIERILDNSKYFRVKSDIDTRGSLGPMFNDKYFDDQWYLHNEAQTGGRRNVDLNVKPAWESGFTGRGIVLSILDDGVDHSHPDIRENYEPRASADMNDINDKANDPMPDLSDSSNSHGTRCAGEVVGVANNGICGVGVAYNAKIGGVRILDGKVTDVLEGNALLYHNQIIDIYSASWGPRDNGQRMESPNKVTKEALRMGVLKGRGGKGSIFMWATGNGGSYGDSCSADGYVSSVESISIQSLSDQGRLPFFAEKCSSTMASVPTGGEMTKDEERKARYKIKVVTTDVQGGCLENFEGTSGAAPLAAGCVALVLQANPDLTWRDVQHIIALGARIASEKDDSWVINGAGYHVNDKFGFGMMDCAHMVELAQSWVNKPAQHVCKTDEHQVNRAIPRSGCHKLSFNFNGCRDDANSKISNLEHVQLHVKLTADRRGDMEVFLTSPSGTRSQMLYSRPYDAAKTGIDFTFMTVHSWMENPVGEWTVEVCHKVTEKSTDSDEQGVFKSWMMTAYGYNDDKATGQQKSRKSVGLDTTDLKAIMQRELTTARSTHLKRAQENNFNDRRRTEQEAYVKTIKNLMDEISSKFDSRSLGGFGQRNSIIDQENTREIASEGPEFVDSYSRGTEGNTFGSRGQAEQVGTTSERMSIDKLKKRVLDLILDVDDEKEADQYLREYLDLLNFDKRGNDHAIKELHYLLSKKK